MRWSRAATQSLALLLLLLATGGGCTDTVSTLVLVQMLYPADEAGSNPLEGVGTIRVRIVPTDGTEGYLREITRPPSGDWADLDAGIKLGDVSIDWARIVLEGLDEDRVVVSAGETIPVPIETGRSGILKVFFQRLGTSGEAPPLDRPWTEHSAAYIEGGAVMIAGGSSDTPADEVCLYALDIYESVPDIDVLDTSRNLAAVAAFDSTKALVVGGVETDEEHPLTTATFYTPTTDTWTPLDLPTSLQGSWVRPLIAELPVSNDVIAVRDGVVARFFTRPTIEVIGELTSEAAASAETLTFYGNDKAALVGPGGVTGVLVSEGTEIELPQPPNGGRTGHSAAALSDGRLVLAGGESEGALIEDVEVLVGDTWELYEGLLAGQARRDALLTVLDDDRVVLSGGVTEGGTLAPDAVVIDLPEDSEATATPVALVTPRWHHTATKLPTGTVMIAGGEDEEGNALDSVEILRPQRR